MGVARSASTPYLLGLPVVVTCWGWRARRARPTFCGYLLRLPFVVTFLGGAFGAHGTR